MIEIGTKVKVREADIDVMGRVFWREYEGTIISVNPRRRWALVDYQCGKVRLRGGFNYEDIKKL